MTSTPIYAGDEDVALLPPEFVVGVVRDALLSSGRGELDAPPRVAIGIQRSVITAGAFANGLAGFRVHRGGEALSPQITAVWRQGQFRGLVTGSLLGVRRTGAIGAVAADVLSDPVADVLGMVGSGQQALAHIWALRAVRPIRAVRIYSRDRGRRERTAALVENQLGVECTPADSPEAAVEGAPLVTLATSSGSPVVRPDAVMSDAHVTTIGPKAQNRHELPLEIAASAWIIATDALDQLFGYGHPDLLSGSEAESRVRPLGSLIDEGPLPERRGMTLFISAGLGGTEVALAEAMFVRLEQRS